MIFFQIRQEKREKSALQVAHFLFFAQKQTIFEQNPPNLPISQTQDYPKRHASDMRK